jgi:asparagine synthase (glutamine-hydrolysing)
MCGIAGFFEIDARGSSESLQATAMLMSRTLRHRGPDDEGVWWDAKTGIALAHRRLSIIDLSAAGHQPMLSASGRYIAVYNGEIYNFQELRSQLQRSANPVAFRGHSDTEVMLACLEAWGVEDSLKRWNGMFAFAVWDKESHTLHLARDRFGEKPLYYAWTGRTFLFGSELKALRAHPGFRAEIDRNALALYLRYNCVPSPYSIYRQAFKLPPASLLTLTGNDPQSARPVPYWSLEDSVAKGRAEPFRGSIDEAAAELEELLRDAVRRRMVSDVPLGVFLSGGVDSSTIAALMQAQSSRPVRSFSIGLREPDFDEATHACAVAEHLGTEHTELYISAHDAQDAIPLLPAIYDEPFADSSQIPTFLLARLTRQQVKVSLSGDGGDETFGGYNRHLWCKPMERMMARIPRPARRALAAIIHRARPAQWQMLYRISTAFTAEREKQRLSGQKLHKLADALTARDIETAYRHLVSHWMEPSAIVIGSEEPPILYGDAKLRMPSATEQMILHDALTYLPDDILTKLDRATMAVSLEARVPFLDHRIAEFVWRLPLAMRVKDRKGKRILRQVLHRYVPARLVDRAKTGFGIPLESWLRGPLREWAEELIADRTLREQEFFSPRPIRRMWGEFLRGKGAFHLHLWDVLMFQAWWQQHHAEAAPASQLSISC